MRLNDTKTLAAGLFAVLALGACDGTGFSQGDFNSRAAEYNSLRSSVNALPLHTPADMPTRGQATYEGFAAVEAATPGRTTLVGDAVINADFTRGTVGGNLSNFVGLVDGSSVAPYNGSIGLRNGQIGGLLGANSLTADVGGTLRSGPNVVTVDGSIEGSFRRDGTANAVALTAVERPGTQFIVNGRAVDGDIGIVAQR
jgi:hypothetical protein